MRAIRSPETNDEIVANMDGKSCCSPTTWWISLALLIVLVVAIGVGAGVWWNQDADNRGDRTDAAATPSPPREELGGHEGFDTGEPAHTPSETMGVHTTNSVNVSNVAVETNEMQEKYVVSLCVVAEDDDRFVAAAAAAAAAPAFTVTLVYSTQVPMIGSVSKTTTFSINSSTHELQDNELPKQYRNQQLRMISCTLVATNTGTPVPVNNILLNVYCDDATQYNFTQSCIMQPTMYLAAASSTPSSDADCAMRAKLQLRYALAAKTICSFNDGTNNPYNTNTYASTAYYSLRVVLATYDAELDPMPTTMEILVVAVGNDYARAPPESTARVCISLDAGRYHGGRVFDLQFCLVPQSSAPQLSFFLQTGGSGGGAGAGGTPPRAKGAKQLFDAMYVASTANGGCNYVQVSLLDAIGSGGSIGGGSIGGPPEMPLIGQTNQVTTDLMVNRMAYNLAYNVQKVISLYQEPEGETSGRKRLEYTGIPCERGFMYQGSLNYDRVAQHNILRATIKLNAECELVLEVLDNQIVLRIAKDVAVNAAVAMRNRANDLSWTLTVYRNAFYLLVNNGDMLRTYGTSPVLDKLMGASDSCLPIIKSIRVCIAPYSVLESRFTGSIEYQPDPRQNMFVRSGQTRLLGCPLISRVKMSGRKLCASGPLTWGRHARDWTVAIECSGIRFIQGVAALVKERMRQICEPIRQKREQKAKLLQDEAAKEAADLTRAQAGAGVGVGSGLNEGFTNWTGDSVAAPWTADESGGIEAFASAKCRVMNLDAFIKGNSADNLDDEEYCVRDPAFKNQNFLRQTLFSIKNVVDIDLVVPDLLRPTEFTVWACMYGEIRDTSVTPLDESGNEIAQIPCSMQSLTHLPQPGENYVAPCPVSQIGTELGQAAGKAPVQQGSQVGKGVGGNDDAPAHSGPVELETSYTYKALFDSAFLANQVGSSALQIIHVKQDAFHTLGVYSAPAPDSQDPTRRHYFSLSNILRQSTRNYFFNQATVACPIVFCAINVFRRFRSTLSNPFRTQTRLAKEQAGPCTALRDVGQMVQPVAYMELSNFSYPYIYGLDRMHEDSIMGGRQPGPTWLCTFDMADYQNKYNAPWAANNMNPGLLQRQPTDEAAADDPAMPDASRVNSADYIDTKALGAMCAQNAKVDPYAQGPTV